MFTEVVIFNFNMYQYFSPKKFLTQANKIISSVFAWYGFLT